jgi:DNA-binding MarR family transcriptional regulator
MKPSAFDVERQNKDVESRIVAALERISEAFRVLLWKESKETALSPIQIQTLIFLLYHPAEQGTVSYLAAEFNLTKATISDSVNVLTRKGLTRKIPGATDARSFTLALTPEGEKLARRAASFALAIEAPLRALDAARKEALLAGLLELIEALHRQGVITLQRMCFTCRYYAKTEQGHYCQLLRMPLNNDELRLDCPEHAPLAKETY